VGKDRLQRDLQCVTIKRDNCFHNARAGEVRSLYVPWRL
jgi:hypothetical protein